MGLKYEVWALGYDEQQRATDDTILLGKSEDQAKAIALAESIQDIFDVYKTSKHAHSTKKLSYMEIRVESVAVFEDVEENIDTIYIKNVYSPADRIRDIDAYNEGFQKSVCFITTDTVSKEAQENV